MSPPPETTPSMEASYKDHLRKRLKLYFNLLKNEMNEDKDKALVTGYIQAGLDLKLITPAQRDALIQKAHVDVFGVTIAQRRADKALNNGKDKDWDVFNEPAYKRQRKLTLPKVFYITGRGGNHQQNLGKHLESLEVIYQGLSLTDDYLKQDFEDQLSELDDALNACQPSHVIANSYGAYLLMHLLKDHAPKKYKVLLLSPVLGMGTSANRMVRPPNGNKLKQCIEAGEFPKPKYLAIYTGEHDAPEQARWVDKHLQTDECILLPNQGHSIDPAIVVGIVGEFLK